MKIIAIPTEENKGLESKVSSHFGDGKFYLIVKTDNGNVLSTETINAPEQNCSKWNCRAKGFLKDLKCDVVIAPRIGKHALSFTTEFNVEMATIEGNTASEVLSRYLNEGPKTSNINEYCPHSAKRINTIAAHAGGSDKLTGAVMVPIYQTSTFSFKNAQHGADCFSGKSDGYIYTRMGNPTIRALEDTVANLEGGYGGLATSTGMAGVVAIYMAFLSKDSHIVATSSIYGPSRVVIERDFAKFGVEYSFVDSGNLDEVKSAMKPNTKMIFVETPANPTMRLTDIAACAEIAHKHGAVLVVDNTFMSPVLQRPLELGADVVFHSMTKFLNGHSDVVAGIIIPRNEELYKLLYKTLIYHGGTMDPHQAYLVIRGIRTLAMRVERGQANAVKVADFLYKHPKVEWVKYPGLDNFDQKDLVKKQMKGTGSLISFGLKGGMEAGRILMDNVKIAALAVSLGGIESLIQHPASMTHAAMSPESRVSSGITDGLVRLSVGCEDVADIIEDLDKALALV